jgi:CheY-like chemotaxis protein
MDESEQAVRVTAVEPGRNYMPQGGRKILIVDDEAYVLSLLSCKFRQLGDTVLTAVDGQEAWEVARRELPDLVISDFQMPVLDGLELARRLKSEPATSHIPVLMLTARGHRIEAGDLERTGVREILSKPFSTRELFAKAEQLVAAGPKRTHSAGRVA